MTLQFFSPTEADILRILTERMVGTDSPVGWEQPSARATSAAGHAPTVITIDAFLTALPRNVQVRFRRALHLFQWCPILFGGKLCLFTQLASGDADTYIRSWAESRFGIRRRLFRGLRDVTFLGYYSQSSIGVYENVTDEPRRG